MGDVVIASAAFEAIYRAFPGCEIHLHTFPPWDRLFLDDPRFKKIIPINLRSGVSSVAKWVREIRRNQYDLIVDLLSNDRSWGLMTLLWMTRAMPRYLLGNHRRFPYHIAPAPIPKPLNPVTQMHATLEAAGIPMVTGQPVLYPGSQHKRRADELLSANGVDRANFGILLPGSQAAGFLKRWGHANYSELATRLRNNGIGNIVVLGGSDEQDECARIQAACGPWLVNLCGQTDLLDLVPIFETAKFVVTNDTGTAHIASATPCPMVMICGPTDPRRVIPRVEHAQALQADIPCINCYQKDCSHHSCMKLITPQQVLNQLKSMGVVSRPARSR